MIRNMLISLGLLTGVVLLQTTLLSSFVFGGVKANLVWIVFVILATQQGSFFSQISGFLLGLILDMITTAPLGFNAFLFSLGGYVFGLGTGKVYFDPIVMPAFLSLLATLFELVVRFALNEIFRLGMPFGVFFNLGVLFQAAANLVLAPAFFWLYSWARTHFQDRRRSFGG